MCYRMRIKLVAERPMVTIIPPGSPWLFPSTAITSDAVQVRFLIFGVFTQRMLAVVHGRFGSVYRCYIQCSSSLTSEDVTDRLSRNFDKELPTYQPSVEWITGDLPQEVRRPERECDHSPQRSVEFKNEWSCISALPHAFKFVHGQHYCYCFNYREHIVPLQLYCCYVRVLVKLQQHNV